MSSSKQVEGTTLVMYIIAHMNWSRETFGEGHHFDGLMKHIIKEVQEARSSYADVKGYTGDMTKSTNERVNLVSIAKNEVLYKLVDIIILALDAMWRLGFNQFEIVEALIEKQNINKKRRYPKITDPSQPTEHIREEGGD